MFFHCFDLAGAVTTDTRDKLLTFIDHIDRVQLIGFIEPDWLVHLMKSAGIIQRLPSLVFNAIQRLWEPAKLRDEFTLCVLNLIEYAKLTKLKSVLTIWIEGFIRRYCRFDIDHTSAETETKLCTIFESYINFDLPTVCVAVIKYVHGIAATDSNRWGDYGSKELGCGSWKATCAWHTANLIRTTFNLLGSICEQEFVDVCKLYEQMRTDYAAIYPTYEQLRVKFLPGAIHMYKGVVDSSNQSLVNLIEKMIDFVYNEVVDQNYHFSCLLNALVEKDKTFVMKHTSPGAKKQLTKLQSWVLKQKSAAPSPVAP